MNKAVSQVKTVDSKREKKQRVFFGLSLVFTIGILAYLFFREKDSLLLYEWQFRWAPFLLSFIVYSVALLGVSLIWAWILNTLSKPLPFLIHFRNYTLSNVAKRLPGTIWYVASRSYLYQTNHIDPKLTALASGVELVISIMSSIFVSILFGIHLISDARWNLISLVGIIIVSSIVLHPKSFDWYCRWLKVEKPKIKYSTIFLFALADTSTWFIAGLLLFVIGNIIVPIPVSHLGFMIGSFSSMRVLSALVLFLPSNFGVTEIGLSLLLGYILPSHIAVLIAIGFRILVTIYDVIWALIAWLLKIRQ